MARLSRRAGSTLCVALAVALLGAIGAIGASAEERRPTGPPGDGLSVVSADGTKELVLGGAFQLDGRFLPGDSGDGFTDTFAARRVRPRVDVKIGERFVFHFMPDFGEGKAVVQDAWLDVRLGGHLTLRAGKQKTPFGLEHLVSDPVTPFAERGLPTGLVPARDVGCVLIGTFGAGRLDLAAGVLNGVLDGAAADLAQTDGKEVAVRAFARPFARQMRSPLRGLGLGFAATAGDQAGSLGTYRTPALRTFFTYATGTVAHGRRTRLSPQASYHGGPVAVLGEYIRSSPDVTREAASARLHHEAWQVTAAVALTGEPARPSGIKPKRPLGSGAGAFGALELVARYGELRLDPETFTLGFARIEASAAQARSVGVGVNWYMTRHVRALVDYEHTSFTGGAASGDRPADHALTIRGQMAF